MTWLPLVQPGVSESDAVLALQPEAGRRLREALALSWRITDPGILEQCRVRMADVLGCRTVTGENDGRMSAAAAYAEQFAIDQKGITRGQKAALEGELSERELVNFVQAINVHDGWLRILSVLDIAPPDSVGASAGQPKLEQAGGNSDVPAGGGARWAALTEPTFFRARMAFGASTALLTGVDDFTTECGRLFNAAYQACAY